MFEQSTTQRPRTMFWGIFLMALCFTLALFVRPEHPLIARSSDLVGVACFLGFSVVTLIRKLRPPKSAATPNGQ